MAPRLGLNMLAAWSLEGQTRLATDAGAHCRRHEGILAHAHRASWHAAFAAELLAGVAGLVTLEAVFAVVDEVTSRAITSGGRDRLEADGALKDVAVRGVGVVYVVALTCCAVFGGACSSADRAGCRAVALVLKRAT